MTHPKALQMIIHDASSPSPGRWVEDRRSAFKGWPEKVPGANLLGTCVIYSFNVGLCTLGVLFLRFTLAVLGIHLELGAVHLRLVLVVIALAPGAFSWVWSPRM